MTMVAIRAQFRPRPDLRRKPYIEEENQHREHKRNTYREVRRGVGVAVADRPWSLVPYRLSDVVPSRRTPGLMPSSPITARTDHDRRG